MKEFRCMNWYSLWLLALAVFQTACFDAYSQAPAPYGPVPSPAQLQWHETGMYCLIHFGPDTYTDKEWGYGDEDPAIFNPVSFDALQIVGAAKDGGFKGIVLVAKHHDGFCLWPTKTTPHNISKSPWKGGKGDMVKEFRDACDKLGMKFGLYCSPWDRNSSLYGTQAYVDMYREQLKELYSNYGPIFISWHDGANGGDGYYGGAKEKRTIDRTTYYGWDTTWAIVRKLQPSAAIFGDVGPDVRWVGNEEGHAGANSWQTYTPHSPEEGKLPANGFVKYWEATEGHRDGRYWMPAECDVPLRPGWFYHAKDDDRVKTAGVLLDLYYKSVGRGAGLDLGLSPDRRGLLHENDVRALKQFGTILKKTFSHNVAAGGEFKASNIRQNNPALYGTAFLTDQDPYSYWSTDDGVRSAELTVDMGREKIFNVIRIRENIKLGQRVDSFSVFSMKGRSWEKIGGGKSIGALRLIRLPLACRSSQVKLVINDAAACPAISNFGLYLEPGGEQASGSVVTRKDDAGGSGSSPAQRKMWKVVHPSNGGAFMVIDGRPETVAEFQGSGNTISEVHPAEVVVDLGKVTSLHSFAFLPPQDTRRDGVIDHFELYVSSDNKTWKLAAKGEFSNIAANRIEQKVDFKETLSGRYVKFAAVGVVSGTKGRIAEISFR